MKKVTATKLVGSAVPDADGRYAIAFKPSVFPAGEDASVRVYVRVLLGETPVWQSGKSIVPSSGTVVFDRELYPDCPGGSARLRVVDDTGRRVGGAQVFVNGGRRGTTDATGQLFVPVERGDSLVARKLLHEEETRRDAHDRDSRQNWAYRVYVTSLIVDHDDNGDDVCTVAHEVVDPDATQDLQLRRTNTLVGLNLRCSLEWDAGDMSEYRAALAETSELLYNGTDGQFLIENLELSDDGTFWDEADIRVHARRNVRGTAKRAALWDDDGYINVNPYDGQWPEVLEHELGHYALDLGDEYKEGDDWDDDNGAVRCTLRSSTSRTPFSSGMLKDSCFMRGNQGSNKKLCSSHPANPHAAGTQQGNTDCWTAVARRYADSSGRWRLVTPAFRGAIPNRLPDSGIPLERTTPRLRGAFAVESHIPLIDWKPTIHLTRRARSGLCDPFLRCRCEFEREPIDGVSVWLRTTYGRTIDAGVTAARDHPDRTSTETGEVLVRGVHVGDRLSPMLDTQDPLFFLGHVVGQ